MVLGSHDRNSGLYSSYPARLNVLLFAYTMREVLYIAPTAIDETENGWNMCLPTGIVE